MAKAKPQARPARPAWRLDLRRGATIVRLLFTADSAPGEPAPEHVLAFLSGLVTGTVLRDPSFEFLGSERVESEERP